MYGTICSVYCGGAGGNHVSNMISLCKGMEPRFESSDYEKELIQRYQKFKYQKSHYTGILAHFYTNGNVTGNRVHNTDPLLDIEYQKEFLNKQAVTILSGHEFNWKVLYQHFPDLQLKNPLWIIFTVPNKESVPGKRILLHGWWPVKPERYQFPFKPDIDSPYVASDGIVLNTELLFTKDGSQYLRELLDPYSIVLPKSTDIIHQHWYEWMVYVTDTEWKTDSGEQ